ncbi:MAG: hypothetical protein HYX35_06580 [Proteobacteria bacterium]|nr:hypothetical protein [Pseudomonadota bacterium]
MSTSKKQDSLKEIVDIFKQDYIAPTKAIVWAKAIQEWGRFIVGGSIIVLVLGYVLFSRATGPDTSGLPYDQQNVLSNLRLIVKFMDITKQSVNERQELYADLMYTVENYSNRKLSQENIQDKLDTLTSTLSICNSKRSRYTGYVSQAKNPLSFPTIAASYANLVGAHHTLPARNNPSLTAESENHQWDLLCRLCANELQKTQQDLAQLLNSQAQAL